MSQIITFALVLRIYKNASWCETLFERVTLE